MSKEKNQPEKTSKLLESIKKAEEFWKDMKVVETSSGYLETKDGSKIGFRSTTFKKDSPVTEDAEFEVIKPKELPSIPDSDITKPSSPID